MTSKTNRSRFEFQGVGRRKMVADFSAGQVSIDGGGLLLREVDHGLRLTERMAGCFCDYRNPKLIEHTVQELLAQRTYGLALGYEDLNDHEQLSRDPLLAAMVGKVDPEGRNRARKKDVGKPLASPSTLGRIERTKEDADEKSRYEKIVCDFDALAALFVELFIESVDHPPGVIVIDLDPSDVPLYGDQEQRFYHGYYRHHCYLPLYVYCGQHPLEMRLRPAKIDGAKGADGFLNGIVWQLRAAWPDVRLIVRGDSGFCRDWLMSWCEDQRGVDSEYEKRYLYEDLYCARGEMENRIKEQQLDLFGDRASCHTFRGNEIRLWLSMAAQLLVEGLRRLALKGTDLAKAQASTLRVKLLKIGALVTVSTRRIFVQLSSAYPLQHLFASAYRRLRPSGLPAG